MANSYALPDDPSSINWSSTDTLLYTRNSGANQLYLQDKLAALEGGEQAVVLASGVAALHAVFFAFLYSGAHVVCSDVTYIAVYRLLTQYLPEKFGVEVPPWVVGASSPSSRAHPVADTADGLDVALRGRVVSELGSDVGDVDVDEVFLSDPVRPPDPLDELASGEGELGPCRQSLEQVELGAGQLHRSLPHVD